MRKLVKIFDIDDYLLQDDLTELLKRFNSHDTGNTEEPFNSVSQVMYSVTWNNIPCLNSSYISGNWRPPPVPKDRDMPKVKGEVHAEEDDGLKDNPGDWCQVPAPVSDPPNLHATGTSYSCMSPSHL